MKYLIECPTEYNAEMFVKKTIVIIKSMIILIHFEESIYSLIKFFICISCLMIHLILAWRGNFIKKFTMMITSVKEQFN
jgi:hypothetical protein